MGHPNYSRDAEGKAQFSPSDWKAPQLGKSLKLAEAGKNAAFKTAFEKANPGDKNRITLGDAFATELPALLGHIEERIKLGLGEAWLSKYGYDYDGSNSNVAYESALDTTAFMDEPEEKWARALCEQFVFTMYHTPQYAYGTTTDKPIFELFESKSRLPLAVACQTLSTYAILTRGIPLSQVSTSYSTGCGCTGGTYDLGAFDKAVSVKKPMETSADPSATDQASRQKDLKKKGDAGLNRTKIPAWAATANMVQMPVTPGSIIVYNAGGYDYTSQDIDVPQGIVNAHSATILRVAGTKVQFIDTGVVTGNEESGSGEGGTTDHSFLNGTVTSPGSLVALGVLRSSKDKLAEYAAKASTARPLGLTRLVITRESSNEVVFVSKLLQMRWPVSKLIWSLRNLPVVGLSVAWFVYSTAHSATTDALVANPDAAPSSFLTDKANLFLTNVLISKGKDVDIYRTRKWENWRHDFSGDKMPIAGGKNIHTWAPGAATDWQVALASKPVWEWNAMPATQGQRYIRQPGKEGEIDTGDTGSPLVDPK